MLKYPEHVKLKIVQKQSQTIHEFLLWCQQEHGLGLAHYLRHETKDDDDSDHMIWDQIGITKRVAQFLEIDLDKLEDEKRAMLDEIRTTNDKKATG